jgi:hypothetical protein
MNRHAVVLALLSAALFGVSHSLSLNGELAPVTPACLLASHSTGSFFVDEGEEGQHLTKITPNRRGTLFNFFSALWNEQLDTHLVP